MSSSLGALVPLAGPSSRSEGLFVVTLEAPRGLAARFLEVELPIPGGEATVYFSGDPIAGPGVEPARRAADLSSYVGRGAAWRTVGVGPARFRDARSALEQLFSEISLPETIRPFVRVFGGGAFTPERDSQGEWESFGDACFVLPRLLYVDGPERAFVLIFQGPGAENASDRALRVARDVIAEGPSEIDAPNEKVVEVLERVDSSGPSAWRELIARAKAGIREQAFDKVVLARHLELELNVRPELAALIGRLERWAPRSRRFALRWGECSFVGATPERLVRLEGSTVESEALAGTIRKGPEDAGQRLQKSAKDRAEHRYVVEALVDALTPLTETLEYTKEPELRELRHLYHLSTQVRGVLRERTHVLDLVERLHPTPAVGGSPRAQAQSFIEAHEPTPRGWYASPFGWVDCRGDGEFVVALRSALVSGARVHLFAGAGIVGDSDADSEFQETELKLEGMLGALGLEQGDAP